jgi:hypothetical protein
MWDVCRVGAVAIPSDTRPSHAVARVTTHQGLAPELVRLRAQFEQVSSDADALVASLDARQFCWRPSSDAWSVGECLDHLNAAARMYLPRLDDAIAEATRNGAHGEGPFKYAWIDRLIVHIAEPPSRIRVPAPRGFLPPCRGSREEIVSALRAYQAQFIDRLQQANGLDLARVRVTSPVVRWLGFSLGAAFGLIAAHERRHLWQARKVVASPRFPA